MSGLLKLTFRPWVKAVLGIGLVAASRSPLCMTFPAQEVKPVAGGADGPGAELAGQPGLGGDGLGRG